MPRSIRYLFCCVALAAAAGCSRAPSFETYEDPGGDFHVEVPKDWQAVGNANKASKPISAVMFVGKMIEQEQGIPMGAVLSLTKFYRRRADYPGKNQSFEKYRGDVLVPSGVLFGDSPSKLAPALRKLLPTDVQESTFSGHPARIYGRSYVQNSRNDGKQIPMRLEDIVIQTPSAYYVIEYRATVDLFDLYKYAFDRARESFVLSR